MDHLVSNPRFSATNTKLISYCRMYLQVTRDEAMAEGYFQPDSSTSSWLHFNKARPSKKAWTLWLVVLSHWFDSEGLLHVPLGTWLFPSN
jgi:hypothetical protein